MLHLGWGVYRPDRFTCYATNHADSCIDLYSILFLIINTIHKLGALWKHTVVCGNLNYKMVEEICQRNVLNVNITDFFKEYSTSIR